MSALHGDAYYPTYSIPISFGYDLFCAHYCNFTVQDPKTIKRYQDVIENGYSYNIYIDGLPSSYQSETECVLFVSLILSNKTLYLLTIGSNRFVLMLHSLFLVTQLVLVIGVVYPLEIRNRI
jgi:Endomembrane protein 70